MEGITVGVNAISSYVTIAMLVFPVCSVGPVVSVEPEKDPVALGPDAWEKNPGKTTEELSFHTKQRMAPHDRCVCVLLEGWGGYMDNTTHTRHLETKE